MFRNMRRGRQSPCPKAESLAILARKGATASWPCWATRAGPMPCRSITLARGVLYAHFLPAPDTSMRP